MNFQKEHRLNSSVLSTIFSAAIYKNKCQIFFFKCHVLVRKGFSNDIYALPRSKFLLYVQNLVFILLMKAALRFGLVFFWTVSLLMVVLVLFVFKRFTRYGLLMCLVTIVLVLDKPIFAPLTLASRPGTSLNFHCDLGNFLT